MFRKTIGLSFILVCGLTSMQGQNRKDTLYFEWDESYILTDRTSPQEEGLMLSRVRKAQAENGIEGYFYMLIDTVLVGSTTNSVRNLKKEVERKEYYFEGPYNKIVNEVKLKANLLDDHVILLVKEGKLFIPKYIKYISYFPRRVNGSFVDERVKDTLVFTGGWKERVDPYSKAVTFHIANGIRIDFHFEIEEVLNENSFASLNISKQSFKGDIDEYLFQYHVQKDIEDVSDKEALYNYFRVYLVYFVKDGVYYRVYGFSFEV